MISAFAFCFIFAVKRKIMQRIILVIFLLPLAGVLFGQSADLQARYDYVEKYYPIAIEKMKEYGIPASITLAQGILESGSGKSELAVEANNHFGIKCHKEWDGETYYMDDDHPNECFRKYDDPAQSYNDHSLFLTTRSRYDFLFSYQKDDYKKWAKGLKKAGYATNPHYANLLIKIIEETGLAEYDKKALDPGYKLPQREDLVKEVKSNSDVSHEDLRIDDNGTPTVYSRENFEVVKHSDAGRPVYENHDVKFIFAEKGDTFFTLAEEFGLYSYQIYRYNELERSSLLTVGEIVYLEKKNKKAAEQEHAVQPGESLRFISQYYAIQLKHLLKINGLEPGVIIEPGTVLRLR
jgi:LysM repeat protein